MSSSRRRGRSSGSPATGRPAPAADTAPEVAPETSQEIAPEAVAAEASDGSQLTAPIEDAEAATETAVIPEIPAETSPETVQAAVTDSVSEPAEPAADAVETIQDTGATTVAETTEAVSEQAVEEVAEAVEAAQTQVVEQAAETVDQVAETAMALAAAPLATLGATTEAHGAKSFAGTADARFVFVPTFAPLNEINATLLAFARGEGEAAVAHFQALTKAKSPAEAIRLQVSEFQRAADASLTCFSHILRSANRLGGPGRWN